MNPIPISATIICSLLYSLFQKNPDFMHFFKWLMTNMTSQAEDVEAESCAERFSSVPCAEQCHTAAPCPVSTPSAADDQLRGNLMPQSHASCVIRTVDRMICFIDKPEQLHSIARAAACKYEQLPCKRFDTHIFQVRESSEVQVIHSSSLPLIQWLIHGKAVDSVA